MLTLVSTWHSKPYPNHSTMCFVLYKNQLMNNSHSLILSLILLMISCVSDKVEPENILVGKEYDQQLLGKWERESLIRDLYNSITVVYDTIIFQKGNEGIWDTYFFDELQESQHFLFYSNQDTLFIQFVNSSMSEYHFDIKEDTLFLQSPVPDSLQHLDLKYFTSTFIKTL